MILTLFAPDAIWVAEQPLRYDGIPTPFSARMTVVRLSTGELWVHSPLNRDEALRRQIDALGPVRYIVAPSRLHYLCVNDFRAHYPEALIFASPKLPRKRPEIPFAGVLGDEPEPGWAGEMDQVVVRGHVYLDEVVFFHRACRTLILTDLMESMHRDSPWLARVLGRLGGIFEKPGPPILTKLGFRDRTAARATMERILAWDFDRVIFSHGHLIPTGGKAVFRQAYGFLLGR